MTNFISLSKLMASGNIAKAIDEFTKKTYHLSNILFIICSFEKINLPTKENL